MRIEKDAFRALCAVVWADGVVAPAESVALLAAAEAAGLSPADVEDVKKMLERPTTLEQVGSLSLDPDNAEFLFSLACVLSASDETVDPRERKVIAGLGDKLGLDPEARERAAIASLAVAQGLGFESGAGRTHALEGFARSMGRRDGAQSAFLSVPQVPVTTSRGPCGLPILYREGSQLGVFFRADLAKARAVLAGTCLEPWPVLGAAMVALYAWDYKDSTVGAYGEVGFGIQCRRKGTSPSLMRLATDMGKQVDQGIWVVNLPVTSDDARAAGIEIWGYPKYVTPISTRFDDKGASVQLGDELELSIGKLGGPRLAGQPVVTYTGKDGRLLRTVIEVDHEVRWGRGGARLTVKGDGPTAARVRELGIDTRSPLVAFRVDAFRAKLPAGVDLGPLAG